MNTASDKQLEDIEVVEDTTTHTPSHEEFLEIRRLVLRNRYADGSTSDDYRCDVVSRPGIDGVATVMYEIDARKHVRVALRKGVHPPAYLRSKKALVHQDAGVHLLLTTIVAGMVEVDDAGPEGLARRAAAECFEEAGYTVDPGAVFPLGAPVFASPGISDEMVHYRGVETDLDLRDEAPGDGSIMEELCELEILTIDEAIARCRSGEIADSKTEIGLLRLCDHLGYVHQLGCFIEDLPEDVRPKA